LSPDRIHRLVSLGQELEGNIAGGYVQSQIYNKKKVNRILTPELSNLKDYLEGKSLTMNFEKLLEELNQLAEIKLIFRSLGVSSENCPTCGAPLRK